MEISDKILQYLSEQGTSIEIRAFANGHITAEIDGPEIDTTRDDFSADVEKGLGL